MKLDRDTEAVFRLQQYGAPPTIDGVVAAEIRRFNDEGGAMIELWRSGGPPPELAGFEPVQINYSTLQPGVIKAFHVHRRQTDVWFVPPEDRVLLLLADVREASPSQGRRLRMVLGDGRPMLVRIPPGVAHGCRNIGSGVARVLYFTDRAFSVEPASCDEGRLPWDLLGAEAWETPRE